MSDNKINDNINKIAGAFVENAKVEGNVVDPNYDAWANDFLPEGVTPEVVQTVNRFTSDMVQGSGLGLGQLGNQHMKANDDMQKLVTTEADLYGNTFSGVYHRKHDVNIDGEMSTRYGELVTKLEVTGATETDGDYARIRAKLNDEAKELFGE